MSVRLVASDLRAGIGPLGGLAVRGDRLAASALSGEVRLGQVSRSWFEPTVAFPAGGGGRVALSADGTHVLIWSPLGDRFAVRSVESQTDLVTRTGSPGIRRSAVACFASSAAGQLVVVSSTAGALDLFRLEDGEHVRSLRVQRRMFVFEHLVPAGIADVVLASGHYLDEGRDSLVTLRLDFAVDDPTWLERELVERKGIGEYAYSVTAGPYTNDAVVVYRDPSDGEASDVDDSHDADLDRSDVYGFRGFYMRRLGGALLSQTPWHGDVPSGAPIFATAGAIVVGHSDRVDVIDAATPDNVVSLPAAVHGFDPAAARIAIADSAGSISVFDLGGRPNVALSGL